MYPSYTVHKAHQYLLSPGVLVLPQANSILRLTHEQVSLLICRNKQKQHSQPDLCGMFLPQLRGLVNSYSSSSDQISPFQTACHVCPA